MQSGDWQGQGWGAPPDPSLNTVHMSEGLHGGLQQHPSKQWGYMDNHSMNSASQDQGYMANNAFTSESHGGVNMLSSAQQGKRPRPSSTQAEERPAQAKRSDSMTSSLSKEVSGTSPQLREAGGEEKGPEKAWERRERHKAIEQRRRDRTKELLHALQTLLHMNTDPAKPAPNMNDILEAAVSALNPQDRGKLAALLRAFRGARAGLQPPRQLAEAADMMSLHALDPAGTYIWVNSRCRELLGFEEQQLIGEPAYSFFHPADMKYINESHKLALSDGHCWSVRYRIRTANDDYRWVETASRLTAKGIACCTRGISDPVDGKPEVINHKVNHTPEAENNS